MLVLGMHSVCIAQPVIPGNEVVVARTASKFVYPDIAVSVAGNVVVTWLDTSYVYDRLFNPSGYGFKFRSIANLPFFINDTHYCALAASAGDCGGGYTQGSEESYAYYRAGDTSGSSFSSQLYESYGCIGGGYDGSWKRNKSGYKIQRMTMTNSLFFCSNEDTWVQGDYHNTGRSASMSVFTIDRTTGNTTRISSYGQDCIDSFDWGIMGYPWLLISNAYEGRHATVLRQIVKDGSDYRTYLLYSLHDVPGTARAFDLPIDTLGVRETYRTEQIVLTSERLFLAHRKYRGDTLLVDMYDTSGVMIRRNMDTGIRLHPVRDYDIESMYNRGAIQIKMTALPGDRIAVVWTGPTQGGGNDLYVQVFNDDMKTVSGPNRINTDTTGLQVFPSIAVRGDTINVVWATEKPDTTQDVYMKSFTIDAVTSRPQLQVPKTLSLTAYPNPSASAVQVTLSGYEYGLVEYEVYNLIGESVLYNTVESGSITLPALASGYYRIRVTNNLRQSWTSFVVE